MDERLPAEDRIADALATHPPAVRALLLEVLTIRDDTERARRIGETPGEGELCQRCCRRQVRSMGRCSACHQYASKYGHAGRARQREGPGAFGDRRIGCRDTLCEMKEAIDDV